MANYLIQVAYTPEAWAAIVNEPQDRIDKVRKAFKNLGGDIQQAYFSFGQYDVVLVAEFPNNVNAAALAIAFAAGGACKSVNTTPLLTREEAVEALKKAGRSGYKPATGVKTAAAARSSAA